MAIPEVDEKTFFYKFTRRGGKSLAGEVYYNLSKGGEPGDWMPELNLSGRDMRGYFGLRQADLLKWVGPELWIIEAGGDQGRIENDRVIFARARLAAKVEPWNDKTMALFACDCAERLAPAYESFAPGDNRPLETLRMVRRFIRGEIGVDALADSLESLRVAAHAVANAAYKKQVEQAFCDMRLLDASRAARVVMRLAMAELYADHDNFDPYLVQAADGAEAEWQLSRKMEYIRGKIAPHQ